MKYRPINLSLLFTANTLAQDGILTMDDLQTQKEGKYHPPNIEYYSLSDYGTNYYEMDP